jgi:hypothetical protein
VGEVPLEASVGAEVAEASVGAGAAAPEADEAELDAEAPEVAEGVVSVLALVLVGPEALPALEEGAAGVVEAVVGADGAGVEVSPGFATMTVRVTWLEFPVLSKATYVSV